MKKVSIATIVAVITALLIATVAFAMFSNGNFETGDFTGWTKDIANKNGGILVGPPPSYVPAPVPSVDDMFIVNAAWMNTNFGAGVTCDPFSNSEICLPYAGSNSAVVNYLGELGNLNKLTQQGLVAGGDIGADGNYHIFFVYAPVLDKGAHTPADQPFMYVKLIRVRSGSPDKVLFDKFSYPDDGNPNWKISPARASVKYMPWQVYDLTYKPVDLAPGDSLTLEVIAAGCVVTQGAHWGYVYVDEFGPLAPAGNTAPSISSLTPPSGPVTGGTTVTITGSNFLTATAVTIDTTTFLAGSFTVVNDTTITFVTPVHIASTVDVSVTNTSGSAVFPGSFTFIPLPAPGAFGKSTPLNLATNVALSTPLVWETSADAVSYEYCIETDGNNVCNGTWTSTLAVTTASPTLVTGTTYNWQARAISPGGTTEANSGTWWNFSTIPTNVAPVAYNDAYLTPLNTVLNGTTVLVNDTDADAGDTLTAALNVGPIHSSAFTLNANGTFSYTPTTGYIGEDTFTYHANDGLANSNIATVTINVTAPLPIPWEGGAVVTSDKPIVAVGRPHMGTPAQVSSYDGIGGGALTAYLPMLFKSAFGGTYNSAFYIQNVDTATAAVSIKFVNTNGTETCTITDSIATLASKGYWLPSQTCLPAGWVGSVVVTSNKNIVVVGRPHIGSEVMSYNGFSAGATTVDVPMLFKQSWGGYNAAMYVQNVSALPADITIKFYDKLGVLTCTMPVATLPALSTRGYWLPSEGCMPAGWAGGAVITSTQNIVALARPHVGTQITAYSGFIGSGNSAYVPMLFKRAFSATYDSALYVQNTSGSTANISIKFYDGAGNLSCTKNAIFAANAAVGYWLPSESCLTNGWAGGALITSDQSVVAVSRPHIKTGGVEEVTAYPGLSSAGLKSYLPMLFRTAYGSYESALYVQNTDPTPAAITIKFYDGAGNVSCVVNETLPAFASKGYWLPNVCQ